LDQEHNSCERPFAGLPPRKAGWIGASVVAHACLFAALVWFARIPPPAHQWVLAYVIDPGAGTGAGTKASGGPEDVRFAGPPLSPPERPLRMSAPTAPPNPVLAAIPNPPYRDSLARLDFNRARVRGTQGSVSAQSRAGRVGSATGLGGSGAAVGGGTGASGISGVGTLAHADYGASPPPAYPARARRRGEQGTVMLRVLVGPDGAVLRAGIAHTSGFRLLDDAALEVVRTRWRFVAARRDGHAVKCWVLVPIRFALTEASAAQ
jgi:protein TonB